MDEVLLDFEEPVTDVTDTVEIAPSFPRPLAVLTKHRDEREDELDTAYIRFKRHIELDEPL